MRDVIITLLVFGSLPFILRRPYIGILVWAWLSYMNPHRLTWGFAMNMPFAQIVAITLLVSMVMAREKMSFPKSHITFFWAAFVFWMIITTVFAIYPDSALTQLIKVLKIQLITVFTLMLITDYKRLNQLIWVIILSIGFFSTKGGFFTLATGGAYRVYGPPGSFIQENNSLAVATLVIIPLMVYLYRLHKDTPWIRRGLSAAIVLSTVSVLGSQSRGALIAVVAVGVFFWLKTKSKLISGIVIVLAGILLFSFMPQSWHERMSSIENYQEDSSAMGRLNAWEYSINVAGDRLTGAGFESWSPQTFAIWAPNPQDVHAAHSIYFGVLADHGWPGLILYLLILWLTWRSLSNTIRVTRNREDCTNYNFLARMLQVSMIAFISGGSFLSLPYFDLPWHMMAIAIILAQQVQATPSETPMNRGKFGSVVQSRVVPGQAHNTLPNDC